jgi:hypothetical protein
MLSRFETLASPNLTKRRFPAQQLRRVEHGCGGLKDARARLLVSESSQSTLPGPAMQVQQRNEAAGFWLTDRDFCASSCCDLVG